MKLQKILLSLASVSMLASSANAESFVFLTATAGTADMDKTVFATADSDNSNMKKIIAYNDVTLIGLEFQAINYLEDSYFMWGLGAGATFNEGSFLEGGTLDVDLKMGGYYNDFSAYGIVGYGIQSLSDYAVSLGSVYGVGINYNLFDSMAIRVEYRTHGFTVKNDDLFTGEEYTLSGLTAGASYKF